MKRYAILDGGDLDGASWPSGTPQFSAYFYRSRLAWLLRSGPPNEAISETVLVRDCPRTKFMVLDGDNHPR